MTILLRLSLSTRASHGYPGLATPSGGANVADKWPRTGCGYLGPLIVPPPVRPEVSGGPLGPHRQLPDQPARTPAGPLACF